MTVKGYKKGTETIDGHLSLFFLLFVEFRCFDFVKAKSTVMEHFSNFAKLSWASKVIPLASKNGHSGTLGKMLMQFLKGIVVKMSTIASLHV